MTNATTGGQKLILTLVMRHRRLRENAVADHQVIKLMRLLLAVAAGFDLPAQVLFIELRVKHLGIKLNGRVQLEMAGIAGQVALYLFAARPFGVVCGVGVI